MNMVDTDIQVRLRKLCDIYQLFDKTMAYFDVFCKEGCASCCTCNVTMTQLEMQYMLTSLQQDKKESLCRRISDYSPTFRYQPILTMNGFARFCMENRDVPEEENNPDWGKCPLLVDGRCTIYPLRPLGCRVLLSEVNCKKSGYALVSGIVQTYQTVFMQAVEHLDRGNSYGNLSDMLAIWLESGVGRHPDSSHLLTNEPLSVMMIPPEQRKKTEPVVNHLIQIIELHTD